MNLRFKAIKNTNLRWQRNVCAGLAVFLGVIALLQSIVLIFSNTKILFLPPEVKQEFWIEGNRFSPSYLEEQGMYFAHLLLDVSPASIIPQGEILLRYTDPAAYGDFRKKLLQEEERLKKDSISLAFAVVECEVFPEQMLLEITGDLSSYLAGKKISTHRETYRLSFSVKKGRLFLKSFTAIKSDQKDINQEGEENETTNNSGY
jgi:conjugal transfer pilus assembly protein TraE